MSNSLLPIAIINNKWEDLNEESGHILYFDVIKFELKVVPFGNEPESHPNYVTKTLPAILLTQSQVTSYVQAGRKQDLIEIMVNSNSMLLKNMTTQFEQEWGSMDNQGDKLSKPEDKYKLLSKKDITKILDEFLDKRDFDGLNNFLKENGKNLPEDE